MPPLLLIDPDIEKRAVLKRFLQPEHRVVEQRSLQSSLIECNGQSFKAAFVAWPGERHGHPVSALTWSSERLVMMPAEGSEETEAKKWARSISGTDPIILRWPASSLDVRDVVARIFEQPSNTRPPCPPEGLKEEPAPENEGAHETAAPPPFPDEVDADGYRTVKVIRTTNFTRVFLAELKFNGDLVILKLMRPENKQQSEAMGMAIALHRNKPEAEKVMVPIQHANTWSDFYLVVVSCLDNAVPNIQFSRSLYRPDTFQRWLQRRTTPFNKTQREEAIDHVLTMLEVLDFFHCNELVMNDVKPDNFGFYRERLVAIDYGGISFLGQKPHEYTPVYGPQEPEERRDGKPAEDLFAVIQILAQALYDPELALLVPKDIEALSKRYMEDYKTRFDKEAWSIIVKGLNPDPHIRYQKAHSLAKDLRALNKTLERMDD